MKKSTKSIKSISLIFLAIVLVFSSLPFTSYAEELTTGSCGENATYSFDRTTGTLTISGTGDTANYNSTDVSPFYNNESIKSVVVEDGITSIGTNLFSDCSNLESIVFPESLTSIGNSAFLNTILREIAIPKNVNSIGEEAFPGIGNLETITVDEQNSNYAAYDNVLFNKDMTELLVYAANQPTQIYTVPDSVTTINAWAFSEARNLDNVSLPEGLKVIEACAFLFCSISEITIPSTVTDIKELAFNNCDSLGKMIFKSDGCNIYDSQETLYSTNTLFEIGAASGATAQNYAMKYGVKFSVLCSDYTENHSFEMTSGTTVGCWEELYEYTCTKCGYFYSENVPSSFHHWGNYTYGFDADTKTHHMLCLNCGYVDEYNDPCAFQEGVITKEATCAQAGELTYTCSTCKGTYTESVPQTDHIYIDNIVSPTCSEQGYTEFVCSDCGDTYQDNYTDAVGHNFSDGEQFCLNGCGEDNPDYKSETEETTASDNKTTTTGPTTAPGKNVSTTKSTTNADSDITITKNRKKSSKKTAKDTYTGSKETSYDKYRIIPGYGQIKAAWTVDSKLEGYEIYVSTDNKHFKKTADVKTKKARFCIIDNLKAGTVYYVKIKGYLHHNGKKIVMNESKVQALTVK